MNQVTSESQPGKKKKIIAFGAILLAVVVLVVEWQIGAFSNGDSESGGPSRSYYSSDDGKTFFVDKTDKPTPFLVDGKEAVRAHVFKCGGVLKVFYLSRRSGASSSSSPQPVLGAKPKVPSAPPSAAPAILSGGIEVKAPGGSTWISQMDKNAVPILQVKCPDGSSPGEEIYP